MGNSSGQRLCPRSVSGASAPLSHTHGLCLPGCSSSCLSAGVLPCSKGRGTWCLLLSDHTDPAALSCPRTAGHAVCSPWHKDQGCPGMEQAEIPGPSTAGQVLWSSLPDTAVAVGMPAAALHFQSTAVPGKAAGTAQRAAWNLETQGCQKRQTKAGSSFPQKCYKIHG